jgi:3-oxoacyl-[acyl-carrier-protein] synthase II
VDAFINGMGIVSPQKTTAENTFLADVVDVSGDYARCIEPNYKEYFSPNVYRRMSRIVKMSLVASHVCLNNAGVASPDAIITGTGLGCVEDTENFLVELLEKNEELLSPTPFIQSTHNTIGSQIAVVLKNHGYNNTFAHRTFSFEHALLDSHLFLRENPKANVLVGGVDELTERLFAIKTHMVDGRTASGRFKRVVPGEGAAYFLLSLERTQSSCAIVRDVMTFHKPHCDTATLSSCINELLRRAAIRPGDINLVVLGINGESEADEASLAMMGHTFPGKHFVYCKHLCGEYCTSSAFALWIAASIIRNHTVPDVLKAEPFDAGPIDNILIYNHAQSINHSLILVGRC